MSDISFHRRTVLVGALIGVAGCVSDDEDDAGTTDRTGPTVGDTELDSTFPVVLEDAETGEDVADIHYHDDGPSHWHRQPIGVPLEGERTFLVRVYDAEIEPLDFGDDAVYELVYLEDEDAPDVVTAEVHGDELRLVGESEGETEPRLEIRSSDGSWTMPAMTVSVDADR